MFIPKNIYNKKTKSFAFEYRITIANPTVIIRTNHELFCNSGVVYIQFRFDPMLN